MDCEPTTTQWVCTHCFIHLVNGDCTEVDTCDSAEPMHLFGDMEVTAGSTQENHNCGREDDSYFGECDCETNRSFSWSACDGCGSPLGGERHAVTGWIEKADEEPWSEGEWA